MKDSAVKRWSAFHKVLFRSTGGRVGKRLVDNDMLLLTTTGASSGRRHTVPLLYLENGEALVVIASYGGRPHHPDWYLNLVANPKVQVRTRNARSTRVARTATDEEHSAWWPRIVEAYDGYREYQTRTDRKIPVVFLDPA